MVAAGRGGPATREEEAQDHAEALGRRVRSRDEGREAASRVPQGRHEDRGLPLPGHVRVHPEDDGQAARRRPARVLRGQLGEGRPRVREGEEPDAVRRADHRLDDREGDDRVRGARQGRGRDLQPAQGADDARHRRDDPLRARRSRDRGAAQVAARERTARTTRARARVCRRPRSRTPASPRSRRPRTRRRRATSTSSASRTRSITSSPPASRSSSRRPASTGTAAA